MTKEQTLKAIQEHPNFAQMLKLMIRYSRSLVLCKEEKELRKAQEIERYAKDPVALLRAHMSIYNSRSTTCIRLKQLAYYMVQDLEALGHKFSRVEGGRAAYYRIEEE